MKPTREQEAAIMAAVEKMAWQIRELDELRREIGLHLPLDSDNYRNLGIIHVSFLNILDELQDLVRDCRVSSLN